MQKFLLGAIIGGVVGLVIGTVFAACSLLVPRSIVEHAARTIALCGGVLGFVGMFIGAISGATFAIGEGQVKVCVAAVVSSSSGILDTHYMDKRILGIVVAKEDLDIEKACGASNSRIEMKPTVEPFEACFAKLVNNASGNEMFPNQLAEHLWRRWLELTLHPMSGHRFPGDVICCLPLIHVTIETNTTQKPTWKGGVPNQRINASKPANAAVTTMIVPTPNRRGTS